MNVLRSIVALTVRIANLQSAQRWLTRTSVVLWGGFATVAAISLMAGHWYTLPRPEVDNPQLTAGLASLRADDGSANWHGIHILYSKCKCSQRVFDHLFETTRPDYATETVLLVGADESIESRAIAAGYRLEVVTPQELKEQYFIESAPLFIVLDSENNARYAGGYTDRKQGFEIHDLDILEALEDGRPSTELPLFGCGVSKELQDILDPLGVKYE